jgi:hypothetical protein
MRNNKTLWAVALVVVGVPALVAISIYISRYYPFTIKYIGIFSIGLNCAMLAGLFLQARSMIKNPVKWRSKLKNKKPLGRTSIALIGLVDLGQVVDAFYTHAPAGKLVLQTQGQILLCTGLLIYMLWLRRYQTNLLNL